MRPFLKSLALIVFCIALSALFTSCSEPMAETPKSELEAITLASEEGLLPVGSEAPNFNLNATGNRRVSLAGLKGKNIVLVFYPMDNTAGCTIQLCRLRDGLSQFEAKETQVLASNPGSLESHEDFAARQHYSFPILVDEHNQMARDYQVNSPVMNTRTVYVIDRNGVIRYGKRGMPLNDELLAVIAKINAEARAR